MLCTSISLTRGLFLDAYLELCKYHLGQHMDAILITNQWPNFYVGAQENWEEFVSMHAIKSGIIVTVTCLILHLLIVLLEIKEVCECSICLWSIR